MSDYFDRPLGPVSAQTFELIRTSTDRRSVNARVLDDVDFGNMPTSINGSMRALQRVMSSFAHALLVAVSIRSNVYDVRNGEPYPRKTLAPRLIAR